ncbi:MAG TPA: polysaccharide-degrading enzyme [Blastocatellia bacterium]|nr:polysaccharide-degrading enzyme [Blastocatellia bacterium]
MSKCRSALKSGLTSSLWLLFCIALPAAQAATFEVGPGKAYSNVGDVPWESLQPGDTVLINWRSTSYKEKWVICRQGTSAAPITVRGVPGPAGELPVIDGNGATTRSALNYWNEARGVVKIGGANVPSDTTPRHIVIDSLDIRSARPPYTFTSAGGASQTYSDNASTIYIEKGENITVRNCILHDAGNGFFVASSDDLASRDILVEGNHIYDNGIVNSIFHHNNYTAAIGIIFQHNFFGPLRAGCPGNNLKDRSAGLVVRYNWIDGGNRQLDLVDGEDSSLIRSEPRYGETHVYGNILIERPGTDNRQIVHYGGDSGATANYRKGILYFYNNTLVSNRTDRTTLFRLSTNEERCDARNNIFYVSAAGNTLSLVDSTGVLDLSHNWFKPGWVSTFGTLAGTINDDGTALSGAAPGFVNEAGQEYHPRAGSACINSGTALHANVIPAHTVARQYIKHRASEARPDDAVLDLGAFEFRVARPDTTGVFRPSNGALFLKNSNSTGFADVVLTYGIPGDIPVSGDWNGDGIDSVGVYRGGTFFLRNSNTNGFADIVVTFGAPGDLPVVGDWDGDGVDTVGVYRNGTFFLRNSNTSGGADVTFGLGIAGDVPISGDWNGDGTVSTGVFRPTSGALFLKNSNTTGFADIVLTYGLPGDKPVTGDWNGDGVDTIGVYREGTFFLRNSNTNGFAEVVFTLGINGDVPIAGDWDGLP